MVVPSRILLDFMANVITNQSMACIQAKMTSVVMDLMTETEVIASELHVSQTSVFNTNLHVPIWLMNLLERPVTTEKRTFLAKWQLASVVAAVQEKPSGEPEFKKSLLEDVNLIGWMS